MNTIFIEAEKPETAEHYFLTALMAKYFSGVEYELIHMRGIANLFNETNMNLLRSKTAEGSNCLAILDADTVAKGWGYACRKADVEHKQQEHGVEFPFFLYPDNASDGDVETLMETLARQDLHPTFFSCFHQYEMCVGGELDAEGNQRYNTPDLKGKLHTYMSAQKLSNAQHRRLGRGDWMFDDLSYWDLGRDTVLPLVAFLKANLK
jgi:hypothetical protein